MSGLFSTCFFRQRHIQSLRLPVRLDYGERRDQHLPAAGLHHKVADGPSLVVEIELIYSSNLAVRGPDLKTFQMGRIR
jgi:hypothetical protein